MKDYQDVVNQRFDKEENDTNSIYSPNHPIGKYSRENLFKGLNEFLLFYSERNGSLETNRLLDLGCGSGGMIEYFISKGFLSKNITGLDFSKTRIAKAQTTYPEVNFMRGDALCLDLEEKDFNLITTFDLFSHFTTKEQIILGLNNVYKHLNDNGLFLWYDIYAEDHFSPSANADSWGFNKKQMISLAKEAGFEVVFYKPLFKKFFNKYHSIYQVTKLPPRIIKLLEAILPGSPGNILMGLQKIS